MKCLPFFVLVILLLNGCSSEADKPKEERTFTIKEIDDSALSNIIKDRKGKVLFINVWATWCAPCIEEFPDIVRVSEHYKDKDVDFLSLNVDMSSQVDSMVIPFMKTFNADFTVYNIKEKNAEKVINILNPEWNGAIPATFIFDKTGSRRIFIIGSEKFNNFSSAIDSIRNLSI